MSTRITGRVVSEVVDGGGHLTGLPGLRVSVHSPAGLFGFELGAEYSGSHGRFAPRERRYPLLAGAIRLGNFFPSGRSVARPNPWARACSAAAIAR